MRRFKRQRRHIESILLLKPQVSVTVKRSVGGGRGWLAGDTDGLAGRPVTVQVCVFTLRTGAGWAW